MNKNLKKLIYSAVMLALAFVLPFLTANNTELGNAFCPMHIPVLLCGFICGPVWGGVVGFTAPLIRSMTLSAPPFPVVALPMAFELATYAITAGLMYKLLPKKLPYLYASLSCSLIVGRVVLGIAKYLVLGFKDMPFALGAFITGSVLPAWPGIILQLIIVPLTVIALEKAKLIDD